MFKKSFLAIAVMASMAAADMVATYAGIADNTCAAASYDYNADGYIYKGSITLTRVASGRQESFYLFNKRGVDYVAKSKHGPYYRLARRMVIDNVEYKY